jgi:hypothetical protein
MGEIFMRIGIIGFQGSGKTTVFNALTGRGDSTESLHNGKTQSNLAVVKIPDERFDRAAEMIGSQKVVYAALEYIDVAGMERSASEKGKSLDEQQLHSLKNADILLAVIGAFNAGQGFRVDVPGDIESIFLELILSDMQKIDSRLLKLEKLVRKVSGPEQERDQFQMSVLRRIRPVLEQGLPLRSIPLSDEEEKAVRSFTFLTLKPLLVVLNTDEAALSEGGDILSHYNLREKDEHTYYAALCGAVEAEIARLEPEDQKVFLKDYGITELGCHRIIRLCYRILNLISFFTISTKEAHSWTIKNGTSAVKAAGVIHSDIEKGFIRAEVVHWDKFTETGGFSQAKKTADYQLHGKEYIIQDGDVVNILFNV